MGGAVVDAVDFAGEGDRLVALAHGASPAADGVEIGDAFEPGDAGLPDIADAQVGMEGFLEAGGGALCAEFR